MKQPKVLGYGSLNMRKSSLEREPCLWCTSAEPGDRLLPPIDHNFGVDQIWVEAFIR